MCGRYTLLADELKILQRFHLEQQIEGYAPSYNIAPGQQVLAIIHDGKKRRAGYMRWGLVPSWARNTTIGHKMINARSETIHEKPSFKNLLLRKHCLIVADSFYEWQKIDNDKQPKRISVPNGSLFTFAGLWDKWEYQGEKVFTCTLLTRDSTDFMQPIHHRMPIILPEEAEEIWVNPAFDKASDAQRFVQQLEPAELKAYNVSNHVNHAKNNDEACIAPMIS